MDNSRTAALTLMKFDRNMYLHNRPTPLAIGMGKQKFSYWTELLMWHRRHGEEFVLHSQELRHGSVWMRGAGVEEEEISTKLITSLIRCCVLTLTYWTIWQCWIEKYNEQMDPCHVSCAYHVTVCALRYCAAVLIDHITGLARLSAHPTGS